MAGLVTSLEVARRALVAQQLGLKVTGNNIANVNTPGFSRKRTEMVTAVNLDEQFGHVGTGVDVPGILRTRDIFLDNQVRSQTQAVGKWESLEKALKTLEANFTETAGAGASETGSIFNEAAGTGLAGALSRFWNSWQDLANDPESGPPRAALRQEADNLAQSFHLLSDRMARLREDFDAEVPPTLEQVNGLTDEIASLNQSIFGLPEGMSADLRDKRDSALDALAALMDIRVAQRGDGTVSVSAGDGKSLVDGVKATRLTLRPIFDGTSSVSRIVTENDESPVTIREGELGGLMEVRDNLIPGYQDALDALAGALVTEVNNIHRRGMGRTGSVNTAFFDPAGTTASTIEISAAVKADLDTIAASADGNPGDNQIALDISALRNDRLLGAGALSIGSVRNTETLTGNQISASTTFDLISGANVNNNPLINDTITIGGTKHDGTAVTGTFTIANAATTTIQQLLDQIESVLGLAVGTVTVNPQGAIEVHDVQSGRSRLSLTLTEHNEGGGSLDFGTFGTKTINNAYFEMVGDIGARTKEATTMAKNSRLLVNQLEERRQSVQGVDLNEETTQLIMYQRAYQAAARTMSVINDLMDETLNLMG